MSVSCASCGVGICLSAGHEAKLRRTHEAFYCPTGHEQFFSAKTDSERRIEALERSVQRWHEIYEEAMFEVGHCPWPECRWRTQAHYSRVQALVFRHLRKVHGVDIAIPKRLAEDAA